jgi:predicted nucleic acid-binding protein
MLMLDTSVWIDLSRDISTPATQFALEQDHAQRICLTECIYLEMMQGAKTEQAAKKLHSHLSKQAIYAPHGLDTYTHAAQLYRDARRMGLTVRSTIDCLIAAQAIENRCVLVHSDRDFFALQRVAPELVLYPATLH